MIRYIISICFALLLLPVSASAFEVPYQRIFQQRGATVMVDIYGAGDVSRYVSCDLDRWICEDKGTSTPELFPGLTERQYFLSDDQSFAVVVDGIDATRTYTLHAFDRQGTSTQTILAFAEPIMKAIFSTDNAKILFVTIKGTFVIFSIKDNDIVYTSTIVGGASFVRFSPHGNYIAYYTPSTVNGKERAYALIDVARNTTYSWKEKNGYWDMLSEEEKVFDFSPDERYFLYLSDRDGVQTLYSTRLWLLDGINNGRLGKRMFPSNFTINNFLYGADGSLYFIANRKNPLTWSLYRYDPTDQLVYWVVDDVLYWPPPVQAGKFILFVRSQGDPPALHALDTGTRTVLPLPMPANGSIAIATGKIKNFSGRYGVLYTPDGYDPAKTHPLIVWLHGGPNRQTSASFHPYHSYGTYDAVLEHLRKNGFIILKLDYRGSYGYGAKFAADLQGDVGNLDVKDVVDATTVLKKDMRIGEIYLMGNSYGGYLALRSLAGKPALFAGAISINGVTDWWTLIKDIPSSIFKIHFNGVPSSKNKTLYDQASIFLRLNNLKDKKIILVTGEDDVTVPPRQTAMLYDSLIKKGIAATTISYEKEGHILTEGKNLFDLCNRVVALPDGYATKTCAQ